MEAIAQNGYMGRCSITMMMSKHCTPTVTQHNLSQSGMKRGGAE
jgi:hypothetical protein